MEPVRDKCDVCHVHTHTTVRKKLYDEPDINAKKVISATDVLLKIIICNKFDRVHEHTICAKGEIK
jgi:hypothetical protein